MRKTIENDARITRNRGSMTAKKARVKARRSFLVRSLTPLFFNCRLLSRLEKAALRYAGSSSPVIGAIVLPSSQSSSFFRFAITHPFGIPQSAVQFRKALYHKFTEKATKRYTYSNSSSAVIVISTLSPSIMKATVCPTAGNSDGVTI